MLPDDYAPPHDLMAERALLGAVIRYPEVLEEVAHSLRPHHFYSVPHETIYATCVELFLHQLPIDNVTISAELEKQQRLGVVGGRTYITQLMGESFERKNASYYAAIISSLSQKRQIISLAQQTVSEGMGNGLSSEEYLDKTLERFFALTNTTGRIAEKLGSGAVEDYLNILGSGVPPPRLAWPWVNLDKILHGLRPGEMTVIGGRPGAGKTAIAINLALEIAMEQKKGIGFFSLEMSKRQLINRMLAQLASVDSSLLQDAKISPEEWQRVLEVSIPLSEASIYVDDNSSLTEIDLVTQSRKMKYQNKIDCIILDYLQLLTGNSKSGNREQEVSGFAQTAKRIARELDIAVVVLSSLNRSPEFREDHRPIISDFRESGGIENEADVILGLYRDYYYNPAADPLNAEVIVLKQRNGPVGTAHLKFEKKYTFFWSES